MIWIFEVISGRRILIASYEGEVTMSEPIYPAAVSALTTKNVPADRDAKVLPDGVLARLIDEVRNEQVNGSHAYNRQHNRHNR